VWELYTGEDAFQRLQHPGQFFEAVVLSNLRPAVPQGALSITDGFANAMQVQPVSISLLEAAKHPCNASVNTVCMQCQSRGSILCVCSLPDPIYAVLRAYGVNQPLMVNSICSRVDHRHLCSCVTGMPTDYQRLMQQCWATQPPDRPTASAAVECLQYMIQQRQGQTSGSADAPIAPPPLLAAGLQQQQHPSTAAAVQQQQVQQGPGGVENTSQRGTGADLLQVGVVCCKKLGPAAD
jgi:hypothetical protein